MAASSRGMAASGGLEALSGALMAMDLSRRRVDDIDFDEATTAMRVIVVAWAVLLAALVVSSVVGSGFGARPSAGEEVIESVLAIADGVTGQIFGAATLFVFVGDGYSKYRRLLRASRA